MSYCHLSSEERYVISHLVVYGLSLRQIGRRLQRHHEKKGIRSSDHSSINSPFSISLDTRFLFVSNCIFT
jgi:hypothetical protein